MSSVNLVSRIGLGLVFAIVATGGIGPTNAETRLVSNSSAQPVSTKTGPAPTKNSGSVRRKRGGPESSPADKVNATPEGQSDLIKVLQPGSGQKSK